MNLKSNKVDDNEISQTLSQYCTWKFLKLVQSSQEPLKATMNFLIVLGSAGTAFVAETTTIAPWSLFKIEKQKPFPKTLHNILFN